MKSAIGLLSLLLLFAASGASADSGSATLKRIAKSGVIRLGYLENAAPFSRAEGGNPPAGYSIDLCTRVAADLRTQLKLSDLKLEWVGNTISGPQDIQTVVTGDVDIGGARGGHV